MFCSNCGKEIPNEAKFCTDCGAKVAAPRSSSEEASGDLEAKPLDDARDLVSADTEAPAIGEEPAAEVNGDSSNAETVKEPVEKEGASPSKHPHAETSNDAGDAEIPCADAHTAAMAPAAGDAQAQANQMSTATGAETGSLKAAVAQNKKRSRRRIPMIVLVALALALATSVAYAAYRAYTDIYLPQQEEQQRIEQIENSANKAENAYNEIVEEYSNALKEYRSGSLALNDIEGSYPRVNLLTPSFSSFATDIELSYAIKDLNGDEVPELLIGYGGDSDSNIIYDMWSYQDNSVIRIAIGMPRDRYVLLGDEVVMNIGSGGADIRGYSILKLNNGQLYDIYHDYSKIDNNWTFLAGTSMDRIDGQESQSSDSRLVKYSMTNENGETESGTCTVAEFEEMTDEMISKYQSEISVEWKAIPSE